MDHDEVMIAISKLKSNRAAGADGLTAELFNAAAENWSDESVPNEWNYSIACPIFKKGILLNCANNRGISLLNIAYMMLFDVLCERLKPFVTNLICPYQCGFKPRKSTTDHTTEYPGEHPGISDKQPPLFLIDFKAAYDSIFTDELYRAIYRMTMDNSL